VMVFGCEGHAFDFGWAIIMGPFKLARFSSTSQVAGAVVGYI